MCIAFPAAVFSIPAPPKVVTPWPLLGVTAGDENFGSFTGSTITDNLNAKEVLQEIETAIEGLAGGHDAVTLGSGIGGLTLSGQELGLHANIEVLADYTDPNADRIWFWDDSASSFAGLAVGDGLTISATTLSADSTLAALAALTIQDASVIQGTGADAFAVLASGGNNYILGSNSDNSALEFKTPANVRSQIGAEATDALLTAIAALTTADVSVMEFTGTDTVGVVTSGGELRYLRSNSGNSALEFAALDSDLTTIAALTCTRGDLMYGNASGAWADLAVGAANTVLTTNGTDPAWSTVTSAMITNDTITTTDLAAALAFAEGDLIDLSPITMSAGVDEGIALPTYADVAPANEKYYLAYDADNNVLMVRESGGWINTSAGSGAATTLNFITTQAEGTLSSESVLTAGLAIDITDAGGDGGAVTVAFDPTEITGNRTWAAGADATVAWTWDVTTGTDPSITFGNDLITASNSVTIATGKHLTLGTTQWDNGSDKIDGEQIANSTIDDDSIDWTDVTAADITMTDAGAITASGLITGSAGVTVATGQHLTVGTTQWDNGSDAIDGERIASDTIDDDSIDFGSGTDQVGIADFEAAESINILTETEIDASSELKDLMDDEQGSGYLVFNTSPTFTTSVDMGTSSSKTDVNMHDAGTIVFYDDGDDSSVTVGPVGDGTTVLGVTGTINATGLQVGGNAVINAASTWSGGDLGGTGLAPTVTDLTISGEAQGEILYYNGSGWESLDVGTSGKVLTTHGSGADPTWETVTATPGGDGSPAGQVQYESSGQLGAEDAFYYTAATNLLTVGNVVTSGYVSTGSAAADSGEIRMSNTDSIEWEAAPAGTNITIAVNADEDMLITTAATDYVQITTGNLKVGDGSPGQTLDGEDFYVNGLAEIDGVLYTDGGISNAGTLTMSANSAAITHSGSTTLAISSTSGTVGVESVTFTGDAITGVASLTASTYVALGAAAADAGEIRLSNTDSIEWEAAPAGTNVTIATSADEDLVMTVAATDFVQVATGNLRVGAGTPTQSQDGEDAYVTGMLEVDGIIYADGGIIAAASADPSLTFSDSSESAVGTGDIKVDAATATYDSQLRIYVDDSTGEDTLYVTVDGSNEEVLFAKKIDLTSAGIENVGSISDDGAISVVSSGSTVTVESVVFTGGDISSVSSITVSDLYLADGGVIYGQNDQSATLTSSASLWTANNFSVTTQFKLPSSDADPTATAGYLRHDSTIANFTNGGLVYYNGAAIKQVVDMTTATAQACTDDQVVAYDADADLWYCKADADSGGATSITDIGDASGDGSISVGGYETTITSTLDEADHSVLTIINTDADRDANTTLLTLSDNDGADANAFYLKLIGDADGSPATYLSISQTTVLSGALTWDLGGATALEIPNSDDPDLTATGQISYDTDGWLRTTSDNGTTQKAIRQQEDISVTVYKPNDLDDAQRDHFWVYKNVSGMNFVVTGWSATSTADDTTLTIYEEDANGQNDTTVDAVEIATNGTGLYYASDTSITAGTIENGHLIYLDFDNTDTPAMVNIVIYGYFVADVN